MILFFRRRHHKLQKQHVDEVNISHAGEFTSRNFVECVHVESAEGLIDCRTSFPNATELIFESCVSTDGTAIVTNLTRIMPLQRLTTLRIKCLQFSVSKLIKLLCHTPNLRILGLKSMPCYKRKNDYASIEQSEDFQFVSNTNIITDVTCNGACTLEQIKLLVALFPRLNSLTIHRRVTYLESIIRFLLDRTNVNTRHLYSLCFSPVWHSRMDKVDRVLKCEALLTDYTSKLIDNHLHLWW